MVELREATPADALDIAAVHVESWQVGYRGLIPDDVLAGLSVESREQWWRQTLSVPGMRGTLVAVQDTAVLGFAVRRRRPRGRPDCGELYAMYLRPTSWRRGMGSALHAAALARLRALGYDRASLWMLAGNERALRFYRRLGWAEDGRRKVIDGPGGVRMDHRGLGRRLAPLVSGEPCENTARHSRACQRAGGAPPTPPQQLQLARVEVAQRAAVADADHDRLR